VPWGSPDSIRATVDGAPAPATTRWVSLADLYEGRPVVLGEGPAIPLSALRPGTTPVEAQVVVNGAMLGSARADVKVAYREGWNMSLESLVPYPDETVGDVWVTGHLALVARRGGSGISIVDLDAGPAEVGRFVGDGLFTQDVKARGNLVLLTHEGGTPDRYPYAVTLIDVADPAAPRFLGGIPTSAVPSAHNVWLDGDLLSIASPRDGWIYLYDVSDPAHPAQRAKVAAADAEAHDMHTRNGWLYGAYMGLREGQFGELTTVDVADPSHPAVTDRITFSRGALTHSMWLSADGRTLYLCEEEVNAPIRIYDVSNRAVPRLAGTYQPRLGTIPHNFEVIDGSRAVLSNYKHGVEVLDVSDPIRPRLIGFYDTHPGADVEEIGLVPAHDEGLSVYEGAWGVHWTDDGRIVVSDMNRGLFVLRFTP